jgi:hypothetical protein
MQGITYSAQNHLKVFSFIWLNRVKYHAGFCCEDAVLAQDRGGTKQNNKSG